MEFKHHYNRAKFPSTYKGNTKPSLTIPDQSLTIKQIVTRFTSGLGFDRVKVPLYEEVEGEEAIFLPDPAKLDLAEREQYVRMVEDQIKETYEQRRQDQMRRFQEAKKADEDRIRKAAEEAVKRNWRPHRPSQHSDDSTNFS